MQLKLLPTFLSVCRLDPSSPVEAWMSAGPIVSITRTESELSVVCEESAVPRAVEAEHGWRALRVAGTLDFDLTGVLASILEPLAANGIAVFALSTFDTDYILVKEDAAPSAVTILENADHTVDVDVRSA